MKREKYIRLVSVIVIISAISIPLWYFMTRRFAQEKNVFQESFFNPRPNPQFKTYREQDFRSSALTLTHAAICLSSLLSFLVSFLFVTVYPREISSLALFFVSTLTKFDSYLIFQKLFPSLLEAHLSTFKKLVTNLYFYLTFPMSQ